MSQPALVTIRQQLERTVGPAPWYWKTFPAVQATDGQDCVWNHHGEEGPIGYVVSLSYKKESETPLLALNTYCRPFFIAPGRLGIWCPEGRNIRVTAFDLNQMQPFELGEIAGWFKQSSERIYAKTPPIAEFEIPVSLGPGMHKLSVPREFATVDELILPTSYKAMSNDDPAFAIFVLYLQAGLVEVLPQKWFTAAQYQVGKQWISRAARDSETHRISGECVGAGIFLLEEDNCRLAEWIESRS